MIFVSFYTGENYKIWSDKLKASLIRFNLPYHIEEIESTEDWKKNTCKKPEFVKKCLLKFKEPVCWLDADCEVMEYPELLMQQDCNDINLQIYNFTKDKLTSGSGVFALNYSQESLDFLDDWIDSSKDSKEVDDIVLNDVYNKRWSDILRRRWIPVNYNRIDRDFPNVKPIINHTYTNGKIFNSKNMAQTCDINTGKCVSDSEWTPRDQIGELQTGDLLEVPINIGGIIFPFIKHYGVLVEIDGKQMVAHNPGRQALIVPLDEFLTNRQVDRVIRTNLTAEKIIKKVEQCKDNAYSFWENNCEDFLSYICECPVGIDQRVVWIVCIIAIIILIMVLLRRK